MPGQARHDNLSAPAPDPRHPAPGLFPASYPSASFTCSLNSAMLTACRFRAEGRLAPKKTPRIFDPHRRWPVPETPLDHDDHRVRYLRLRGTHKGLGVITSDSFVLAGSSPWPDPRHQVAFGDDAHNLPQVHHQHAATVGAAHDAGCLPDLALGPSSGHASGTWMENSAFIHDEPLCGDDVEPSPGHVAATAGRH